MGRRIEALERHVIVCGFGRVGRHVCADLLGCGVPFVVIDRLDAALAAAREAGAHPLRGDATADATLRQAGIERARALIAVAGTDPDNVLITMTARLLRPTLPIVARAEEEATVPKLLRAGATRTVSPHAIVGGRVAQAVLRPAVLDFIEAATGKESPDLEMEEQLVQPGSPLDGKTVGDSGLRSRPGLILVAIKRRDGQLAFNPGDDTRVTSGDTLITLGRPEQVARADALALSR
jgi:voltage-gated potassium channel